jgi:hypothetical protein
LSPSRAELEAELDQLVRFAPTREAFRRLGDAALARKIARLRDIGREVAAIGHVAAANRGLRIVRDGGRDTN